MADGGTSQPPLFCEPMCHDKPPVMYLPVLLLSRTLTNPPLFLYLLSSLYPVPTLSLLWESLDVLWLWG